MDLDLALNTGVSIEIGTARRSVGRRAPAPLAIVGVASWGSPWLEDLFPNNVLRSIRNGPGGRAVEHVRMTASQAARRLPGLDGPEPSRVRDATLLALSSGLPFVDLIMSRMPGVAPWELDNEETASMVAPYLFDLPGAVLVYPDMCGAPNIGPGTGEDPRISLRRLVTAAALHGETWAERWQIGLFDLPPGPEEDRREAVTQLIGTDGAACDWQGSDHALACHGWRSGAALVGGIMATSDAVPNPIAGARLRLPPGRRVAEPRDPLLALRGLPERNDELDDYIVPLRLKGDEVEILSDTSFRRPQGEWPLPAMRVAKLIHRRMVEVSEAFVFRQADTTTSMALSTALQDALWPFVTLGLIEGTSDGGPPSVEGSVERYPTEAGLSATLETRLVPWNQRMVVRVALTPSGTQLQEVEDGG